MATRSEALQGADTAVAASANQQLPAHGRRAATPAVPTPCGRLSRLPKAATAQAPSANDAGPPGGSVFRGLFL